MAVLPVKPHYVLRLADAERERIAERARRLLASDPALSTALVFGPDVAPGIAPGAGLFYEDHSSLGLAVAGEETRYEYRIRMLAGSGDVLILGGEAHPAFDDYCREIAGLGAPRLVRAPRPTGRRPVPLPSRCRRDPALVAQLAALGREAGGLTLYPYAGSGHDWLFAQALAAAGGAPVRVAAPLPGIGRRANDKGWFAEQVAWLLGRQALPLTFTVLEPAALAGRIAHLAKRHSRMVIKVPDSAGGKGNLVLDSALLRGMSLASLRRRLLRLLANLGWRGSFPLVAGVWEGSAVSSPSAQVWIPVREDGLPVVEGLFVQVLAGAEGEFVGAEPSNLPPALEQRMSDEAFRLACLFQALGYFGRCSFDAVLVGERLADAELHWIECNGRWGGVSIPMTLVNRLCGDWHDHPFVVVQQRGLELPARGFDQVLRLLSGCLFRAAGRPHGVVLMSPRALETGTEQQFVAIGRSLAEARAEAETARTLLLA